MVRIFRDVVRAVTDPLINSVPLSADYDFTFPVDVDSGQVSWVSIFDGSGSPSELVNPFDLLARKGAGNDQVDQITIGRDEQSQALFTVVHELGHALGLHHKGLGTNVMRTFGPAAVESFGEVLSELNLRWLVDTEDQQ